MIALPSGYTIQPLASHHDRVAFSCGEASLDTYIKTKARQDVKRDLAACYILSQGDATIIGFYTLSPCSVALSGLPDTVTKIAGGYSMIPSVLIGRLAIDKHFQGQRMGEVLLVDALQRVARSEMGIKLVIVGALHEQAAHFYERYDFRRFADMPMRLYLALAIIRQLFPNSAG